MIYFFILMFTIPSICVLQQFLNPLMLGTLNPVSIFSLNVVFFLVCDLPNSNLKPKLSFAPYPYHLLVAILQHFL